MKIWMKWLLLGLLSIAFGIFVLANPLAASIAVTTLAGFLFLASGIFQIVVGFGEESTGGKLLGIGLGILMALLGVALAFNPLEGVISLSMVVTILFAAGGLTRLMFSFRMRQTEFFWPMLLSGVLSLLLALYIAANFFQIAPGLLGILLGIELLFNGSGLVVFAFVLRKAAKELKA